MPAGRGVGIIAVPPLHVNADAADATSVCPKTTTGATTVATTAAEVNRRRTRLHLHLGPDRAGLVVVSPMIMVTPPLVKWSDGLPGPEYRNMASAMLG